MLLPVWAVNLSHVLCLLTDSNLFCLKSLVGMRLAEVIPAVLQAAFDVLIICEHANGMLRIAVCGDCTLIGERFSERRVC